MVFSLFLFQVLSSAHQMLRSWLKSQMSTGDHCSRSCQQLNLIDGMHKKQSCSFELYSSHQTITLNGKTSSMFPRGQEPLGVNCKILWSVTPLLSLLKWGKVFLYPPSPVHFIQVLKCLHLHWEQHSSFKKIAGGRENPKCRSRRWLGVKASGSLGSSHTLVKGCLFIIASISHPRVTTPSS